MLRVHICNPVIKNGVFWNDEIFDCESITFDKISKSFSFIFVNENGKRVARSRVITMKQLMKYGSLLISEIKE